MSSLFPIVTALVLIWGGTSSASAETNARSDACAVDVAVLVGEALPWPDDAIARYTGCVRDDAGDWVWPEEAGEVVVFSSDEARVIEPLLSGLQGQIADMLALVPSAGDIATATNGVSSYGWGVNGGNPSALGIALGEGYVPVLRAGVTLPGNDLLATFVNWWSTQRQSARPVEVNAMNPQARGAYDSMRAWLRAPWPFELESSYQQALFFRWMIDHDLIG